MQLAQFAGSAEVHFAHVVQICAQHNPNNALPKLITTILASLRAFLLTCSLLSIACIKSLTRTLLTTDSFKACEGITILKLSNCLIAGINLIYQTSILTLTCTHLLIQPFVEKSTIDLWTPSNFTHNQQSKPKNHSYVHKKKPSSTVKHEGPFKACPKQGHTKSQPKSLHAHSQSIPPVTPVHTGPHLNHPNPNNCSQHLWACSDDFLQTSTKDTFLWTSPLKEDFHLAATASLPSLLESDWILDSGASCHMTPYISYCYNIKPAHVVIKLANGATTNALSKARL